MTIPDGTLMDEDRRAMRAAASMLVNSATAVHNCLDDSATVWGLSQQQARVLTARLDATTAELERHLAELRAFRESVR
jgi:phosphoglycolate phosphatase-like HAD superfamily hydrolase